MFQFSSYTTFLNPFSIQNIIAGSLNPTNRHPCFSDLSLSFPSTFSITWGTFCPDMSAKIRNVFSNVHSLICFLHVNWNSMFTELVFWLSQAFKLISYCILIIVKMMKFSAKTWFLHIIAAWIQRTFVLLCKRH